MIYQLYIKHNKVKYNVGGTIYDLGSLEEFKSKYIIETKDYKKAIRNKGKWVFINPISFKTEKDFKDFINF